MAPPLWTLLLAAVPLAFAQEQETPAELAHDAAANAANLRVCKYIAYTWVAVVAALLFYRWTLSLLRHVRQLANLNHASSSDGRQKYFSIPDQNWAWLKRNFIFAPLFKKRHNREFKLSAAVNVGTLPGRVQTLFLLGYFVMNITLCAFSINWHSSTLYDDGRNRAGVVATLNLIPLFLLAGRNNPLIFLLGISFDTYNLIHRWIGRIVVFEAVAHVAFYIAGKIATMGAKEGWHYIGVSIATSQFMLTGTIGAGALIAILLQSPSAVRHAFYETFLHVHVALIIIAVTTIWIHLLRFTSYHAFIAVAVSFWVIERGVRMCTLIYRNTGKGLTKAEVEALPGDAVRVTLRVTRPWKFRPGQHVYLYMPSVGLWTSHPFSLAWSSEESDVTGDKELPVARQDILAATTSTVSLVVRRRTGFTDKMWKRAEASPSGKFIATALVEGPYGHQNLQSYGTVMLFAAGIGITHQVPHIRDLISAHANGTCATRRVALVWIIQSPEHLEWIRPWMTQILGMEGRRALLRILLFVTRPRSTKEIHSPSASVQMFPGKPDVAALVAREQAAQVGAMAVSVCGTGGLADDVRRAVRDRCEGTEIDVFEEAFSW